MKELPQWAKDMLPIDLDGAAKVLGISRRFLIEALKDHPHFERRGAKKVFYREHIIQLREALSRPKSPKPTRGTTFSMPLPLTEEHAFEEAMRLVTQRPKESRSGKSQKARH